MKKITDKQRLDWLQKGYEVIPIVSHDGKKIVFATNFVEQEWKEFDSVRDAIDFAIKNELLLGNNF